jgi:probable F420-dependent oxidoreductase
VRPRVEAAIAIPQTFVSGRVEPTRLRDFLGRAEALGFHSVWVVEQILGRMASLEPVALLAYAAAHTTRLRLGSAVLLTALRSPIHLAKMVATIDQLSSGRLIVGVGLGGNPAVYPAYGLTADRRVARFVEGLRVMKALWSGSPVTFKGEFFHLDGAILEPKPVQRPHPPLWFGGHHPSALRRAVALGDGFIGAGSAPTAAFAEQVTVLHQMLGEAGRDPAAFPVGKRVYIALDRDRDRAGTRLSEWFGSFYGKRELAAQVSVWGDESACLDGLAKITSAGARLLLLNPVFDEAEQLEQLAASVVPKLSA